MSQTSLRFGSSCLSSLSVGNPGICHQAQLGLSFYNRLWAWISCQEQKWPKAAVFHPWVPQDPLRIPQGQNDFLCNIMMWLALLSLLIFEFMVEEQKQIGFLSPPNYNSGHWPLSRENQQQQKEQNEHPASSPAVYL